MPIIVFLGAHLFKKVMGGALNAHIIFLCPPTILVLLLEPRVLLLANRFFFAIRCLILGARFLFPRGLCSLTVNNCMLFATR